MTAPTVFGPDRLATDVAADLALRGIVVDEVSVGTWLTEWHEGPARVVIGVGKGRYENAADTLHATDGWIDVGGGQVARAILARVWTFPIWVHAVAPGNTPPDQTAEEQMRATIALADQTAAAVARTRGGLPMLPWASEPVNEERGEFVYGGCVRIDAVIAIPVFDDPCDTMVADSAQTGAQVLVDGVLVPASPEGSSFP